MDFLKKLIPNSLKQFIMKELTSQMAKEQPYLSLVQRIEACEKMLEEFQLLLPEDAQKQKRSSPILTKVEDLETALWQLQSILVEERHTPPPPPKHLQIRVVGGYVPDFIKSGFTTYKTVNDVLCSVGKDVNNFTTILDFGCGCGRIIRAFRYHLPSHHLLGTDIDPEAIDWLKNHYGSIAEFVVNPHVPPMPYPGDFFDFIYSISIFTHLPEEMQFKWLEDLRRVIKPGGYMILTTHGEKHYKELPPDKLKLMNQKGFYYNEDRNLTTEGLPAFYKVAYHSPEYIEREWKKYFDVLKIMPRGLEDHQDIILLQKR
jgi:SAM-dependent methyltransferase